MLFLGDAHDQVVADNIRTLGYSDTNKLKLDLVKISHHGSQHNTSSETLSLDSPCYVISTDGSKHGLPNKGLLRGYSKLQMVIFSLIIAM
jgi:beta-lactamase superfamily II metal-dependent hydrolase